MLKLFFKGDAVPENILTFHKQSEESILPKKVVFLRTALVIVINGVCHVRPLFGFFKVNSIYIDELEGCIIKSTKDELIIHVKPLLSLRELAISILLIILVLIHVR